MSICRSLIKKSFYSICILIPATFFGCAGGSVGTGTKTLGIRDTRTLDEVLTSPSEQTPSNVRERTKSRQRRMRCDGEECPQQHPMPLK